VHRQHGRKGRGELDLVLQQFGPDRIILAADAKDDQLVISGWKESAGIPVLDFIGKMTGKNITRILCTDVNRDGMLGGTSVALYEKILDQYPGLYLIASGGVGGIGDIELLDRSVVPAVVFGKAFYEGKLGIDEMKDYL
jgi:phosphoribosylformimino-5-aminoimidazole carboxamide ribotide isomerase